MLTNELAMGSDVVLSGISGVLSAIPTDCTPNSDIGPFAFPETITSPVKLSMNALRMPRAEVSMQSYSCTGHRDVIVSATDSARIIAARGSIEFVKALASPSVG